MFGPVNPQNPIPPVYAWFARTLTLFALLAAAVTLAAWPIVRGYDTGRADVTEARERGYVDAAALEMQGVLREVAGDLQVTASLPAMRAYLEQPDRQRRAAIVDVLGTIVDVYARYDHVRVLDASGRELVRVDDDDGHAQVAPDARLQAEPDPDAVAAAAALGRGDIHVSPMVPGTGNGTSDAPDAPSLRFTTPLFDRAGNRAGILVLDVRGDGLLRRFRELASVEPRHEAMLLDAGGRRLTAAGANRRGVLSGNGEATFGQAYPAEWAVIAANARGALRSERGLFAYATVPMPAARSRAASATGAAVPGGQWKAVLRMAPETLQERSLLRLPLGRWLFATIYVLLLLLAALAAYLLHQLRRTRLREQVAARQIRDLYERAPCGYHSLDRDGVIVRMNETELGWLGYRREEVVGRKKITELMTDSGRAAFARRFPQLLHSDQLGDVEFDYVRKDGSLLPVVVNATVLRDAAGNFLMTRSTVFDATERRQLEQELQRQARTDVLTGVGNRRQFFELAGHELARSARSGHPLALLLLDIDEFKRINDAHGHDAGDLALKAMAAACAATLRESDLFARIGGEEFAALLPESDAALATAVAERLRGQVEQLALALPDGTTLRLTVSIGVAVLDPADRDVDRLVKRADLALYRAKASGRNRVCTGEPDAVPA